MTILTSSAIWIGFVFIAIVLMIHFIKDIKGPTQGERIRKAFWRLERYGKIM